MAYQRITVTLPPSAVSFANQKAKELAKSMERVKPNLSKYIASLILADRDATLAAIPTRKKAA